MSAWSQHELAPLRVGDIRGTFSVPRFQRGYRWQRDDVTRLLDDLVEAEALHPGKDYWLQPIVLKPLGKPDAWELIDGQQRLTTLFLIFKYLKDAEFQSQGPLFTIEYETRPGTGDYLKTLDSTRATENIDFHHIRQAYDAIAAWLDADGRNAHLAATKLYLQLMERVRIIWYAAPLLSDLEDNHQDSIELFTRLNVGKIPLTNAELVKATLLRGARLGARDRSIEVAAEWDLIERDLHHQDLWAFATRASPEEYPTRISLLLDGLAPWIQRQSRPRWHTFDTIHARVQDESPGQDQDSWPGAEVWEAVVARHDRIRGWFEDRDVYHLVGFLVAAGSPIDGLLVDAEELGRSALIQLLQGRIRRRIGCTSESLLELRYDRQREAERLGAALLLMNTESVRRSPNAGARYPFRLHHDEQWSLEHILAQNAQELTKADQWQAWLSEHRAALEQLPAGSWSSAVEDLSRRIGAVLPRPTREQFETLSREVIGLLSSPTDRTDLSPHGINNLALLSRDHNSQLSNAVFAAKRRMVLEIDRAGGFIPPCTRRVFLKYYTDDPSQQLHFWGKADQLAYILAAQDLLRPYLDSSEPDPEGDA